MPNTAFITGTSSGLGYALANRLIEEGHEVYGCSRRGCHPPDMIDCRLDLTAFDEVPSALGELLSNAERLDLVVLNAGVLGDIRDMTATSVDALNRVMEVNVWANKVVLDALHAIAIPIGQIVAISSGAAVLGNRGWSGYSLSKAALNMLMKLYAHEFPQTHLCALAPGIIDTAMMDYLCDTADAEQFPALQRLRDARGTERMPNAAQAAERVLSVLSSLRDYPSGSFVDIRAILEPQEYARLFGKPPSAD
ncbi:SDR family NAD(P)-dependent oxidoreductase [Thiosocius teredinicola]|uniref:SDR family NAD(P)-dependent oxidoreductase n=1 Tax=Thiosocius teredinicola TaxID=1973002 RepID=UPI000991317F